MVINPVLGLLAVIALILILFIVRHHSNTISPQEKDDHDDVMWCKIISAKAPNEVSVQDIMEIFKSYISENTGAVPNELYSFMQEYANSYQKKLFEALFTQDAMCNSLMEQCMEVTYESLSFNREIPKGKKGKTNRNIKEMREKVTDSKFVSSDRLANTNDIEKVVNSTIVLLDYLSDTEGRKRPSLVSEKNCKYLKSKKNELQNQLQRIQDFSDSIEQECKNLTTFDNNCKGIGILLKIHRWNI